MVPFCKHVRLHLTGDEGTRGFENIVCNRNIAEENMMENKEGGGLHT